jgi:hypothetical protein
LQFDQFILGLDQTIFTQEGASEEAAAAGSIPTARGIANLIPTQWHSINGSDNNPPFSWASNNDLYHIRTLYAEIPCLLQILKE